MDMDTLDMAGNWTLIYGYTPGLFTDRAGHWRPATQRDKFFDVALERTGPGDHGGMKFKGTFKDNNAVSIVGETLYGRNGVQVVQMRLQSSRSPGYYELLCGRHQIYQPHDPVEILGCWVSTGGSSNIGNFVLVRK